MTRFRVPSMRSFAGLALASSLLLSASAAPGCSGETTAVAEGDAAARRNQKEQGLKSMLNPSGSTAPAAGSKSRAKRSQGGAARPGDSL